MDGLIRHSAGVHSNNFFFFFFYYSAVLFAVALSVVEMLWSKEQKCWFHTNRIQQILICASIIVLCLFGLGQLGLVAYKKTKALRPASIVLPTQRSIERTINSPVRRRVLVHIGKTAGMTVRDYARHWIDYEVHTHNKYNYGTPAIPMEEFHPKGNDVLYISLRDPLKRLVSAWNFRRQRLFRGEGPPPQRCDLCTESQCVALFEDINEVGEDLYEEGSLAEQLLDQGCIHLVRESITHFVEPLIDFIRNHPDQIYIIRLEHVSEDMNTIFGVKPGGTTHKGPNGGGNQILTAKAERNFKRWLKREYELYHWLLSLKNLDP
eukprot:gb/GECG01010829.1/.p1 GENE.gb/GECG01010829.1/~~gb/GECG01010829.1/.p1  ORF type:complete len:321 (+),score=19.76 gb/GECG01010829.1/:1-963(+)